MSLNLDKSQWKRVSFGDVVANVNRTVKDPMAAGLGRVVAMEHLDPGELKIERWGDTADGTTFTRRVEPGQTLFGKRRAYQRKAAFADFPAVCSGDILTFEADEQQLLPEFLPFIVQSDGFYDHALGTSAGSLSPRTNWRDLATFEFGLPPLDAQREMACLLWSVEKHRRQLVALSQAAQDVFRRLLQAHCQPSATDRVRLQDVVQFLDSRRVPLNATQRAQRPGKVPYYGAGGPIDSIDDHLFDEPLVLLCEDGFGLAAWNERPIAYRIDGPSWVNNHAHVLRATGVSTDWLLFSLMHYDLSALLANTVKPKLNLATAKKLFIRRTDQEASLTQEIQGTLDARDNVLAEIDELQAFKLTLLTSFFGGAA